MEKRANYTLVGITMIILVIVLIALILWLSLGWNRQTYQTYLVYMDQAVTGLKQQSAVQFNGVAVGSVDKIQLNPHNPQQVKLYLKIIQGTPISTSTVATLAAQGITGISYVALSAKTADAPVLKPEPGGDYAVIPSAPSFFVQLDSLLTATSDSMQALLSQQNLQNLNKTLNNLQAISEKLANNMDLLVSIAKDAKTVSATLANHTDDISNTLQQGQQAISNFNQLSLQGKAAVGATTNLLMRLDTMTANLNQLLDTIQQNPAVIVRGAVAAPQGPGE